MSRERRGRLTAGRTPGASTTSGASSAARRANTTRSSPRTTPSSACRRERASEYYLPDDLTNQAIGWLHAGARPGPGQALLHVLLDRLRATRRTRSPTEWSEKYRGKFDQGWDKLREETFAAAEAARRDPGRRQADPAPDALPGLGLAQRRREELYARQMEVYAGFQENADWNVGRLLDAIDELGELDNTLVLYIFGDNGASMEGTDHRLVQRVDDAERHPADPASSSSR